MQHQAPGTAKNLRGSRIFNMLNNALGVSLLAVSWVCSKAQEGQLTTAGIRIYLDDPKSYPLVN